MSQKTVQDKPLVAIVGPTASGKTALALKLAQKFSGEIICADSRTIYKGMDVGTAKPTKAEQKLVPHHMLDLVEPGEKYTTYRFKKEVSRLIDEIRERGKTPFLVGGSGLYLYTILFDYDFDGESRRDELIDNCVAVGIDVSKEELYQRIEGRFTKMLKAGLEAEVKKLVKKYGPDTPQLKRNVYGEMQKYLQGEISYDELLERAKIVDWQLAKKQRTWFRHHGSDQIKWLPLGEAEKYLSRTLKK
jgi:tRNA dimethylallyltransferase